ncbi:Predicted small secreted protein [Atopostipes suicloacalis DSM 15692]|uniref:Predicted small secreted protein n=1 Tax=Atopostipes suicloacalis DSM 15692 TaxID=1121025 RepID=A0A1M4XCH9_9LACT|nr:PepSY domain-containing protein [Atopostipes suicloacalis]SHE91105.1 Predicted small secreted protein [Atopostipes suicloacalis DSM 15692]
MVGRGRKYFAPLAIIAVVASFLMGAVTFFFVEKKIPVSADRILEMVKKEFKKEGPIEGSWIEMTKVPWEKYNYQTKVYYGGISRFEEGKITQYEFIADAYTGSVMDIYKV